MIAAALLALAALQAGLPDSVRVTGEPNPYAIFAGRRLILAHLVGPPGDSVRQVVRGQSLGTVQDYPARLSNRHHDTILKARESYGQRRYADAAAQLARAYADEPDNPFVANEYARTLFWLDDRRDESFTVYRRLIEQLDRQHGTNDRQVAVDAWFGEAYWKIASLYLDREAWEPAAFEITRFLAARGVEGTAGLEQVFTYLAEAYVRLGRAESARWSAEQALRRNPRNAEALGYLYELGAAARTWGLSHVFACRLWSDTLPCIGGYSFHRTLAGLTCMAPREEPATPLSPCLRLGWMHVGQARGEVEEIVGSPWQPAPARGDGTEGFAYLVFQDAARQRGSYYVVEYERVGGHQVARSIQLTGDSTPLPIDFSGLLLGDPPERVQRQLGAPASRGEFTDEAQGLRGEWWDWTSAPISLEIVNGRLYSVRLWRPDAVPPAVVRRDFSRFR